MQHSLSTSELFEIVKSLDALDLTSTQAASRPQTSRASAQRDDDLKQQARKQWEQENIKMSHRLALSYNQLKEMYTQQQLHRTRVENAKSCTVTHIATCVDRKRASNSAFKQQKHDSNSKYDMPYTIRDHHTLSQVMFWHRAALNQKKRMSKAKPAVNTTCPTYCTNYTEFRRLKRLRALHGSDARQSTKADTAAGITAQSSTSTSRPIRSASSSKLSPHNSSKYNAEPVVLVKLSNSKGESNTVASIKCCCEEQAYFAEDRGIVNFYN
jgi:hypothetical protein